MDRLLEILGTMDVPALRVERQDWRWMLRNLAVRNSNHPDFSEARKLILEKVKKL